MKEITEIIERWRRLGKPDPTLSDQAIMRRETLRDCADELELAWHAYAHDAAWFPESCPLCEAEMATMRPGEPPRSQREAMLTTSEEARELWRRGRQGHTDLGM